MNNNFLLLALLISFLWGIQPIIYKYLLTNISPITLMILNGSINLLCIGFLYLYYKKEINKDIKKLSIKDYSLIIFSVIIIFLSSLIFYSILQKNKTSIITALVYSAPFFTLISAYLVLNEKINILGFFGILLIILGVILIAFNDKFMLY